MKRFMIICLLAVMGLSSCAGFETVPADEFASRLAAGNVQLLDVRTSDEFNTGHIPGAINLDWKGTDFVQKAKAELKPSVPVALYCRGGRRSADAAKALVKDGYEVFDLKGGVLAWAEKGLPLEDVYGNEVDIFTTDSGKEVYVHAMIHATMYIEYDSLTIYIDPVSRQGGREFLYMSMPKADYVFVTHEHGDHFDRNALANMTAAQLITNARCAEMLGYGIVMANGDVLQPRDDIKVEAVPAYNCSPGRENFHPKGRDNGFILTLDGLRIYLAGDTEDIPELADVKDIDVAYFPCNLPYTMTPDQLVNAVNIVKPKVVFPYHFSNTDVSVLPARLPDTDVRIRKYQ
ncbi:MAG: MBL fold metallo-hydrolase [Bacteroidales bacterium]|nr:MBL fold metallo-hydrolase [Bacteroidales bacterium]